MNRKRFNQLIQRMSTGELTDAEHGELLDLCGDSDALRTEVRRTEAIPAAARESAVEQPSDFEWAAFSTRLNATIEAEQPRAYGRFGLWLDRVVASLWPRRLAVAASAVTVVAIAVLIGVVALRPGPQPEPVTASLDIVEPAWEWEEIAQYYPAAETLPDPELLSAEQRFWDEMDKVDEVIEDAPSFDGNGEIDEAYILG
jgi:hypothetical protein